MSQQEETFDANLYSRQIYAIGGDVMKKMVTSRVIITGMSGLGIEIAKNVILQGCKEVLLHDQTKINSNDVGVNYYVTEQDVGKWIVDVVHPKLAELNSYVKVNSSKDLLKLDSIKEYDVFICVDCDRIETTFFDTLREFGVKIIRCSTKGLTGQIFCDFGNEFFVNDPDGEQLDTGIIESIENSLVTTIKEHNLTNSDIVLINNVQYPVKFINRHQFSIGVNISVEMNTLYTQVKQPQTFKHVSYSESLKNPNFVFNDHSDFERPNKLHAMYMTDAVTFDEFKQQALANFNNIEDDILEKYWFTKDGKLVPINSIIGGIVALEVTKACGHKYTPISQWLYYDAFGCLSDDYKSVVKNDTSRYKLQIEVFGKDFQQKLFNSKYFIVGSGAIGCELLKNFSMIGLGHIIVTDPDHIELSNLSRQFLFRNCDIKKPKSLVAATRVNEMNPLVKVEAMTDKMCPETETKYDKKFYDSLTGVANALDNVAARVYVDHRCVTFKKSLLESGTLGTKCNTQVIIPHVTESYGSMRDPEEQSIPVCTIKMFPNNISHCIQYAKELFNDQFVEIYNTDKKADENHDERLVKIYNRIPVDWDMCVALARQEFDLQFDKQITDLITEHPIDEITKDGVRFWSAGKKFPERIVFDANNDLHKLFVDSYATILANTFNIQTKTIGTKLFSVENTKLSPSESTWLNTVLAGMNKQEFEKDDDSNRHIDFITAVANLRALNYSIQTETRHEIKGIAGKIIPALASVTSIVAGFVTIELYKLFQGFNKVEQFRNVFANPAINFYGNSDPIEVKKINGYSLWDNVEFKHDPTVQELIDFVQEKYHTKAESLLIGGFILYSDVMPHESRLNKTVTQILTEKETSFSNSIVISFCGEDGTEISDVVINL